MSISIPPVDENPCDCDIHFLEERITEYNVERTGIADGRILSWFVHDSTGAIVAGLFGWTWGGCCEVRYLWVRRDHRSHGYGKALMEAAENEARARGCHQMVLDTHSFQALSFYEVLGFKMMGTHADYPRGHRKHYLKKNLRPSGLR